MSDIKKIYSHPQGFLQCDKFLKGRNVEKIPYINTASAAKYVSELNDKEVGAIASLVTAKLYDLDVLENKINNNDNNFTKFIVISKKKPQSGNRMNILFTTSHEVGSLVSILDLFREYNCNMESISSRALKHIAWEYYFYVEVDFDPSNVNELIVELEKHCRIFKVIGKYKK